MNGVGVVARVVVSAAEVDEDVVGLAVVEVEELELDVCAAEVVLLELFASAGMVSTAASSK